MALTEWPDNWQERKQGLDCLFCEQLGRGDNEQTLAVAEMPFTEVRLERRSRLPGYCILMWRLGHVAEPTELDREAASGYWDDLLELSRVLEKVFQPVKLNVFTLGNVIPHLHSHVVPRYLDDPAPGRTMAWEAMVSEEPSDPQILESQALLIRGALSR